MKRFILLVSIILLAFISAACQTIFSAEGDSVELKLAHNQTLDHPVHLSLVEFGRILEENSDGRITTRIYANEQLGSEREVIELVQTGAVDVAKVSASALEGFEMDYSIFSLPYVFEDYDEFVEKMNNEEITGHLYNTTADIGFVGLTYYNAGTRNLYTKDKKVEDVSDMRGLKVRVQPSRVSVNMIEALGGLPTPMAYGEVYTGLQSGVIDAAENNETALVGNNHGEVAKYYMYTGHQIVPDMLIMNHARLDGFSEEDQQLVYEAAEQSTEYHEEVWHEAIEEQTRIAQEKLGVEFVEVDKQPFIDAVQEMHKEYASDENTREIFELFNGGGE